jgi:predicted negative regulator of RcsB-dependent stress response
VAKITRKQLKQDRFAEEVTHSVSYVSGHRKQVTIAAVVAIAIGVGAAMWVGYQRRRAGEAREAFHAALEKFHGAVETEPRLGRVTFSTSIEKYREVRAALEKVASDFSGHAEGSGARYYLALVDIEQKQDQEGEEKLKAVVDSGHEQFAAMARLALGDLYVRQGKLDEARVHYQYLIDHPSDFVPKARAQLALARAIAATSPEEARKMLEELRQQAGPVAGAAITTLREVPDM